MLGKRVIVLTVLEEILNNALFKITQEIKDLTRSGDEIVKVLETLPAQEADKNNFVKVNPKFKENLEKLEQIKADIRGLNDERVKMKERIQEMETIEQDNKRIGLHFDKRENYYECSLSDLIELRVTEDEIKELEERFAASNG